MTSEKKFDEHLLNIVHLRQEKYQEYVDSYLVHWPADLEEFVMELDVEGDLMLVSHPNMDHKSGYYIYRAIKYIQWRKDKGVIEKQLTTNAVVIDYGDSSIYIFSSYYQGYFSHENWDSMYECIKDVFPKNFTVKHNIINITDGMGLYLGEIWSSLFAEKLTHQCWSDKNPQKIIDKWLNLELRQRKQIVKEQLFDQPKFDASVSDGICQ